MRCLTSSCGPCPDSLPLVSDTPQPTHFLPSLLLSSVPLRSPGSESPDSPHLAFRLCHVLSRCFDECLDSQLSERPRRSPSLISRLLGFLGARAKDVDQELDLRTSHTQAPEIKECGRDSQVALLKVGLVFALLRKKKEPLKKGARKLKELQTAD